MKRSYILPSTAILALALAAWFGHTRAAYSQQGQPNGTSTASPAAINSPTQHPTLNTQHPTIFTSSTFFTSENSLSCRMSL